MFVIMDKGCEMIDKKNYEGSLTISGTKLEWKLKLAVLRSNLQVAAKRRSQKGSFNPRELVQLTLTRSREPLELDDKEYGIFIQLTMPMLNHFDMFPNVKTWAVVGARLELVPEVYDILCREKFGLNIGE